MAWTRKLTPEQKDEVIRRYLSGENPADIGKDFGVTQHYARVLANRRGLSIGRGGAKVLMLRVSPELHDAIISASASTGRTVSSVVERALRAAIERAGGI